MLLSSSISRRYTPPTCTLEINAQTSALSRWARQPVLKQLQFRLSFDNLLRPDDQPTQISGDRAQLDALCEAVEAYVQKLLNQLPRGWYLPSTTTATQANFEPEGSDDGIVQAKALAGRPEPLKPEDMHLQPRSLLLHDLFLGSLATEATGSVINLSTSQLFDLASALEEYAAETIALPTNLQQRPLVTWVQGTPIWARTAAVAVVVVGITTAALQLTNNSNTISQKPSEQPTALPPTAVPPPPPSGSTPLPSPLPAVTVPSKLPSIEPPPVRPTSSGAAPEPESAEQSEQSDNSSVAVKPSPVPTPKKSIVIQPRTQRNTSESQTPAASKPSSTGSAEESTASSTATQRSQTLSDTRTQVQKYFDARWQPPPGLTESLEYRLILRPDGTILRAQPLKQVAEKYYSDGMTPIPLDEPVASPVDGNPQFRLRLEPDGQVKTLLDSSN